MPAGKQKSAPAKRRKAAAAIPQAKHSTLYYRLHALLHTVRTIAEFEDQLCTLMHEAKAPGFLPNAVLTELQEVLVEMPSFEYRHELDGLSEACEALRNNNGTPRPQRGSGSVVVKPSRRGAKRAGKRK